MSRRPLLSERLRRVVDALPLTPGLRVVEIGCGPGAAAIEVVQRVGPEGHVLAVDRSTSATAQLRRAGADLVAQGRLTICTVAVEDLVLPEGTPPFDLAFAIRVGALDGRHPQRYGPALAALCRVLAPHARLFVDGGDPLRELDLAEA